MDDKIRRLIYLDYLGNGYLTCNEKDYRTGIKL